MCVGAAALACTLVGGNMQSDERGRTEKREGKEEGCIYHIAQGT